MNGLIKSDRIKWAEFKGNGFFNEDFMVGLEKMPDKFIDLAICDPPYGIGEDGSKNHSRGKLAVSQDYKPYSSTDDEPPSPAQLDLINRKCKNWIIFGANHFIDNFPFNISSPCWIVWDKKNGNTDFADCELAITNFKSAVRMASFKWQGMLQGDMKNKEKRIHPNQKPVALYQWILEKYAKDGDIILDTHVGSASSLIACGSMGFNYVGYEIDPIIIHWQKKEFQREFNPEFNS